MSKSTVRAGMAVIAGLVACVSVATAEVSVDLIGYQFLSSSNVWEYSYGIDNTTGSDWIYSLELDLVDMATITGSATAWDNLFSDTSIGGYASWAPTDGSHWLAPGGTLNGFVIESVYGPGTDYAMWGVYGDDNGALLGGDITFTDGQAVGPEWTAVPEPASMALYGLSLLGIGYWRRRKTS